MARELIRQGGRSARIQQAVHEAVGALLSRMDRAQVTVPMIAEAAGVTPSTIYRRWGDLPALLADVAVQRLRPIGDPEDTGSASGDLQAWLIQYIDEMSSPVGRALVRDVLGAGQGDQAAPCWRYTYDQLGVIADRAAGRGEPSFAIEAVVDDVVAPVMYHVLFRDRPLDDDYARTLLARVRWIG